MNQFLEKLDAEIQSLEAGIQRLQMDLNDLVVARRIYIDRMECGVFCTAPITSLSVSAQIVKAATELLADGQSHRLADILAAVEAKGIEVGGQNKLAGISAVLNRFKDRFTSDRKTGWRLVKQEGDTNAATFVSPINPNEISDLI